MSPLALRIVSAAVLAPLVLFAVWWGGWLFAALCFITASLMLYEWRPLTATPLGTAEALLLTTALALAVALALTGLAGMALALVFAVALVSLLLPPPLSLWRGAGLVYAGVPAVALVTLRMGADTGLAAVIVLLVMVWATDIAAYAAGRLIGGPKIWPAVSPSKTWAGLAGGIAASAVAGVIAASFLPGSSATVLALMGALVAIVAQAGDFLESAIKRRFGAKDSGNVIPGHGGIMDRVDGLIAAAVLAMLVGVARAGPDAAASGFLIW